MKIATYNVNGVNGRLPLLLRWLAQSKPDVVCLQELKALHENFPESAIRDAGYGVIWHGQKSYSGVAIISRGQDPIETQRGLPGDPEDLHSRYIQATIRPSPSAAFTCQTVIRRRDRGSITNCVGSNV